MVGSRFDNEAVLLTDCPMVSATSSAASDLNPPLKGSHSEAALTNE
ncbi:MAG: hypothetical protein HDS77_09430 [Bacteroidales bacterium]|nr:hypothetical protein [Bacteroidales bacterium]